MMRGFVTIATGDTRYYELAKNLLVSYKRHTKKPMPFAIVADRENEYTKLFDKVVLLDNPHYSFMDKISMLYVPPFKENIFIDADCLAYGDLNDLWKYMPDECGVVAPGLILPKESKDGFFDYSTIGHYQKQVKYNIGIHGGIYFFRDNQLLKDQLNHINYIYDHFHEYKFKYFNEPADESLVALSIAIMGLKPVKFGDGFHAFVFYPIEKKVKPNIQKGELSYITKDNKEIKNVYLIHWTNYYTTLPCYKIEVDKLYNRFWRVRSLIHYKDYYKRKLQDVIFEKERFPILKKMWMKFKGV